MSTPVPINFLPPDRDLHEDGRLDWVDGRPYRHDLPPGSAAWIRGTSGGIACLDFVCPCGCGVVGAITVREGFGDKHWQWDGDERRPTLKPSIQKTSPCRWHGFLTDGSFVSC